MVGPSGILTLAGSSISVNLAIGEGNTPAANTGTITTTVDSVSQTFPAANITAIHINAGNVSVTGNIENDSNQQTLPPFLITINGAGSVQTLTNDQFAPIAFDINGGNSGDNITVQGADFATINGGSGNDTIQTIAGSVVLNATINGGAATMPSAPAAPATPPKTSS